MKEPIRTLSSRHFTRSGMPLATVRVNQEPLELHSHEFTELVVILTGECMHVTETESYRVAAGDVFVIHPGVAHGYTKTASVSLLNILFDMDKLQLPHWDLVRLPGYHALFTFGPRLRGGAELEGRLRLDMDDLAELDSFARAIEHEIAVQPPGYQFTAVAKLMEIISLLSRAYGQDEHMRSSVPAQLGEVLSFMENHLDSQVTVPELARLARMSESTFMRAFRRTLDSTPIEHMIRLRMRRASTLLCRPELGIAQIAAMVGFRDANYFSRQFRKVVKLSPSQYRERWQDLAR